jgi:hypothetical protein
VLAKCVNVIGDPTLDRLFKIKDLGNTAFVNLPVVVSINQIA